MKYFFVLFLLTLTNQELISTSTNYFQHLHCNDDLVIEINSIKYLYYQYNCTAILRQKLVNQCANQSSCFLNFKPFLRAYIPKCRKTQLQSIRVNYTCIKMNNPIVAKKNYTNMTMILCICLLLPIGLLALLCSYLRHCAREHATVNDPRPISPQNIPLKNVLVVESSSSSTLTSLKNKDILSNPSEYDNLIRHPTPS